MEAATATPAEIQRTSALKRANKLRLARAKQKRGLRVGASPVAIILHPPEEWASATVAELVRSCHRFGKVHSRQIARAVFISESRRLGELTERQRYSLVMALRRTEMGRDW